MAYVDDVDSLKDSEMEICEIYKHTYRKIQGKTVQIRSNLPKCINISTSIIINNNTFEAVEKFKYLVVQF